MVPEMREMARLLEEQERALLEGVPPPPPLPERPTIHYTELHEDTRDCPGARDWNFYRREVGRLIVEGHEGEYVLIRDQAIVGFWPTFEDASRVAAERYLLQPVLIQQVLTRTPILRVGGYGAWLR